MPAHPSRRRFGLFTGLAGAALLAVGGLNNRAAGQLVSPGSGKQWSTTWSDEFNIGASDLNGFTYDVGAGGWGNNELQSYTAPAGSPTPTPSGLGYQTTPTVGTNSSNVFVSSDASGAGALHIAAIVTGSGSSKSYTSGRIKTSNLSTNMFAQAYGLFEFRAKLPLGQGLWPALWMLPANASGSSSPKYGGWPTSGEVDILESKGQSSTFVQGSLQSGSAWNTQVTQTATYTAPSGFSTADWHTYDLMWTAGSSGVAGSIKWYVDGNLYETQSGGWYIPSNAGTGNKDAPFDQPFYILMNVAVGGNYPGSPNLNAGSYQMQVDYVRAYSSITGSSTPTWKNDTNGNWTGSGNWISGVVPNATGATALFGNAIASPRTVSVDAPVTVGTMSFDSSVGYTIGGSQTITLNVASGSTGITVARGGHTINAPLAISKNLVVAVNASDATLTFGSALSTGSLTLTKNGTGTMQMPKLSTASLALNQGVAQITAKSAADDPSGTSVINALSIASGAQLDLTNNSMVLDYTGAVGTLVDQVRQHLLYSRIASSLADATHSLAYVDNATVGLASFGGVSVDSTSILVKYTYAGDANLDGQVDVTDLGALATNWQAAGIWTGGDFNYDGTINVTDLGIIATNWQAGVGSPLISFDDALTSVGLGPVSVPEPSVTALTMLAIIGGAVRRKRQVR